MVKEKTAVAEVAAPAAPVKAKAKKEDYVQLGYLNLGERNKQMLSVNVVGGNALFLFCIAQGIAQFYHYTDGSVSISVKKTTLAEAKAVAAL